jgi:hypothetical protein
LPDFSRAVFCLLKREENDAVCDAIPIAIGDKQKYKSPAHKNLSFDIKVL